TFSTELDAHLGYFVGEPVWSREIAKGGSASKWVSAIRARFAAWDDLSVYLRLLGDLLESYLTLMAYFRDFPESVQESKVLVQKVLKYAEGLNGQGKIIFPESLSVQSYANATLLLDNQEFLVIAEEGQKKLVKMGSWSEAM